MSRPKRTDIALAFGIVGSLTALALILFGNTEDLRYVWVNKTGLLIVAAPSAWLAGLACAGLFGLAGRSGWLLAGFGACLSTMLGAALAGMVVVPVYGALFAPIVLIHEALKNPVIIIAWLALMVGLHIMVLKLTV